MKNSFTTFELILSITLSSVVIIYSLGFSKQLLEKNKDSHNLELNKIDLLNSKIFLQKHKKDLSKLEYKEEKLYFENSLLLENIKYFNIENVNNTINIDINMNNKIKQKWSF